MMYSGLIYIYMHVCMYLFIYSCVYALFVGCILQKIYYHFHNQINGALTSN